MILDHTPQFDFCVRTVPYREGQVWIYDDHAITRVRIEKMVFIIQAKHTALDLYGVPVDADGRAIAPQMQLSASRLLVKVNPA